MLVDWERISLLADPSDPSDQEWLKETIVNLASDLNARISNMDSTTQQKNWEELKASLHQMRGVASNFGLSKLADLSTHAEDSIRNSEFEKASNLVQEISKVWQETKRELQQKFPVS